LLNRLHSDSGGEYYDISAFQPDITNATTVASLFDGDTNNITYTGSKYYVCAVITGQVTLAGFATCDATAGVAVSPDRFQLYADLNFSLGIPGIDLKLNAVGVMDISVAGLFLQTNVSLDAQVTTLLHLKASGTLFIDTIGVDIFELN